MLVLSRKENETIVIDSNIHVTIVHMGRGRVKIGIQAPANISIVRSELGFANEQPADFPSFNAVGVNYVPAHCALPPGT